MAVVGIAAVLTDRMSVAMGILLAGAGALAMVGDSARGLLLALVGLLSVPPTRVQQAILESGMSNLPNDPIVRASFSLMPATDSYVPEALLASVLVLLVLRAGQSNVWTALRDKFLSTALLLFVTICTFNVIIAMGTEPNFLAWLRDFIPVATLMAVFPLSALMSDSVRNFRFAFFAFIGFCMILLLHSVYVAAIVGFSTRISQETPYNTMPFVGVGAIGLVPFFIFRRFSTTLRLIPLLCMSFLVLMLTQTRALVGALVPALGVIGLCALYIAWSRNAPEIRRRSLVAFAILTVIFLSMLTMFGGGLIDRMTNMEDDGSARWRPIEVNVAYEKFTQAPMLGSGLGSSFALPGVEPWRYIHNSLFYYLADIGMIGTTAWLLIFAAAARTLWLGLRRIDDELMPYAVAYAAILPLLVAYSLFQTSYRAFQNSILIALCLAGLQASGSFVRRSRVPDAASAGIS